MRKYVISTPWKPDEEAALRVMWNQHCSSRVMSEALGRTKNSVLGKAHALKLPKHGWAKGDWNDRGAKKQPKVEVKKTEEKPWRAKVFGLLHFPASSKKPTKAVKATIPLIDLKEGQCRTVICVKDRMPMCCGLPVHKRDCCEDHFNRFYTTLPLKPFRD